MRKLFRAFTLIELLVVIAIIAVLAVVVVLVINPVALLQQARDANRLSDIALLNHAVTIYLAQGGTSLGPANMVGVSLPDGAATSTAGDQCQGLGLIATPSPFVYHCAATGSYRGIGALGWVPVDFASIPGGTPLPVLPVDVINSSSSRLYYSYATNGNSIYEFAAALESSKYKLAGSGDVIVADGGPLATVFEKGNTPGFEPLDYGDRNLIGYWPFDEGAGTVAYDHSGTNATGSWSGFPLGSSGYYSPGVSGQWAGYFDGTSDAVAIPAVATLKPTSAASVAAWVFLAGSWSGGGHITIGFDQFYQGYSIAIDRNNASWYVHNSGITSGGAGPVPAAGTWHFLTGTFDAAKGQNLFYLDGVFQGGGYFTPGLTYTTSTLSIAPVGTGVPPFLVDSVRVYNRVLSPAEIIAMYNGKK